MFAAPGQARPHYQRLLQRFTELTEGEFDRKRDLAALTLLRQGVTFTVYSDAQGTERIFPFDLIPRIISGEEWKKRSEEHTSELQSHSDLVCRLLLEKK